LLHASPVRAEIVLGDRQVAVAREGGRHLCATTRRRRSSEGRWLESLLEFTIAARKRRDKSTISDRGQPANSARSTGTQHDKTDKQPFFIHYWRCYSQTTLIQIYLVVPSTLYNDANMQPVEIKKMPLTQAQMQQTNAIGRYNMQYPSTFPSSLTIES